MLTWETERKQELCSGMRARGAVKVASTPFGVTD
jgi:hypothetical protein